MAAGRIGTFMMTFAVVPPKVAVVYRLAGDGIWWRNKI